MLRFCVCIIAVALLVPPGTSCAQLPVQLEPDTRVRVKPISGPQAVYIVIRVDNDVLVVLRKRYDVLRRRTRHDSVQIPFEAIQRLQLSGGRDPAGTRALRGAGYGALVLGSIGAIAGAVGCSGGSGIGCSSAVDGAVVLGGLSASVGGLFGALFGLASSGERWEEVPLDRLRVSFAPQRDGRFALGLSVSF
jgi:hypothetical protein